MVKGTIGSDFIYENLPFSTSSSAGGFVSGNDFFFSSPGNDTYYGGIHLAKNGGYHRDAFFYSDNFQDDLIVNFDIQGISENIDYALVLSDE